jgi:hypothetical protein
LDIKEESSKKQKMPLQSSLLPRRVLLLRKRPFIEMNPTVSTAAPINGITQSTTQSKRLDEKTKPQTQHQSKNYSSRQPNVTDAPSVHPHIKKTTTSQFLSLFKPPVEGNSSATSSTIPQPVVVAPPINSLVSRQSTPLPNAPVPLQCRLQTQTHIIIDVDNDNLDNEHQHQQQTERQYYHHRLSCSPPHHHTITNKDGHVTAHNQTSYKDDSKKCDDKDLKPLFTSSHCQYTTGLLEMGFTDISLVHHALANANGDFDSALDFLLSQPAVVVSSHT